MDMDVSMSTDRDMDMDMDMDMDILSFPEMVAPHQNLETPARKRGKNGKIFPGNGGQKRGGRIGRGECLCTWPGYAISAVL